MKKLFFQWLKFAAVGSVSIAIQLFFLFILTDIFLIHYLISASIAFIVSVTFAFVYNRKWTYEVLFGKRHVQYAAYLSINTILLFANVFLMYLLVDVFNIYYLLSQLIAILSLGLINFFAHRHITFKIGKLLTS